MARDRGSPGGDLVRPSTLSSLAKEAIRTRIVTGEFAAGEIYSAPALAALLGVSATPIREAMLELTNDGLVEAVPNRGFRVVELPQHELDEIFEVRLMLEVPGTVQAARGELAAGDRERLLELVEEIEKRAEDGDTVGFLAADRDFHLGLLATVGNSRLVDIVSRLRDQARLYGLPVLAQRGELRESAREHRELLEAVSRQDTGAAAALMTHHLEHTRGIWAGIGETAGQ
jgi:DNA-binding GntR family transcriptional regulator